MIQKLSAADRNHNQVYTNSKVNTTPCPNKCFHEPILQIPNEINVTYLKSDVQIKS